MENSFSERDKVGVQDFVLLEKFQDFESFLENLRKRFKEKLIYTYIGQVLISVNPYQNLNLYSNPVIAQYQNVNFYQMPPHLFAIADTAYRAMKEECRDQCILISGESGSGKTEASKKILNYLAAVSKHRERVEVVKDKLILSNPVLEAFGNAKTIKNDNSSRFGKYMDIEFDYLGVPLGGHIINYLLEKSRVIHQNKSERNFHIFYQLISGIDDSLLSKLQLRRDSSMYYYLNQGESVNVVGIDDAHHFNLFKAALKAFDFSLEEEESLFLIVASILHMGNTGFFEDNGQAVIAQQKPISTISKLLGCSQDSLKQSFINKSIEVRNESVFTPLSRDQAIYARDALAKAIYDRLFTWLVAKLNTSLANDSNLKEKTLIGLLDIYGFEVFEQNCFEQFCINYCNEKLQQLLIELTLKLEQEEYRREEIEWKKIDYFNNQIICDLVEERHKGIIAILDEECLRPGDATDMTFLQKLESTLGSHPHFDTHNTVINKLKKTIARNEFRINHYAGEVVYKVDGFLDKNNDSLYRDLKRAISTSDNLVICNLFSDIEVISKKRPETAITQFKYSLIKLTELLSSKEPWYIRCIKPNELKRPGIFDDKLVGHQVKYLGLMENLRVRRAGFAYRRTFEVFLERYKCLSKSTWPFYKNGSAKKGVNVLMQDLKYNSDDYRLGQTKIFIRLPKTLFEIEDAFQTKKQELATMIQAYFKGYVQCKAYKEKRKASIVIQSHLRRHLAIQLANKKRTAAAKIRNFIKGFITRNQEENDYNREFVQSVRREWLIRLSKNLPETVLDKTWPLAPSVCQQASKHLHKLYQRHLVYKYCTQITAERKEQLEEKVLAEELFKNKKASYHQSIANPFVNIRLSDDLDFMRKSIFESRVKQNENEYTVYASKVIKLDRHGYKARNRVLILTNTATYILDEKDFKLKHRIYHKKVDSLIMSNLSDGLLIIKLPCDLKDDKGDIILDCGQNLIEMVTKFMSISNLDKSILIINLSGSVSHYLTNGKQGYINFKRGNKNEIFKRKDGILQVISL